jgi:protein subunit release factor B
MKELLFSVTANDCKWDYFNASGPGGQNVNKNQCGVRCTHIASAARGQASDTKHQAQNKKLAFHRMAESEQFRKWHKLEIARRMGTAVNIDEKVEEAMNESNLKIEVKENGKWKEEVIDE